MSRRRSALALLLVLGASPLAATVHPNTAPGFTADHSFHSGNVDNVNLFNGSLTVTVPIGNAYPVNGGFSYSLKLVYNSNPWTFKSVQHETPTGTQTFVQAHPNLCSNAGLGWRVSLGQFNPPCQVPDINEPLPPNIYQDESGADHLFYSTLHQGDPEDAPLAGVSQILYTHDNSYLRLKMKTDGTRELEFPDGTVRSFDTSGRLTRITDPFGNFLNVGYATNQWTLTDSLGQRNHRILFRTDLPGFPQTIDRIELAAFGSPTAKAIYQFNYAVQEIGRACPHSDSNHPAALGDRVTVPLLTSVTLPDGSSWHNSAGDYIGASIGSICTQHSGNIQALFLPTLGKLEWTWQTLIFPQGSGNKPHVEQNPAVLTRTMRDRTAGSPVLGTWTYTHAPGSPAIFTAREKTTTVTDPLNHKTVHYFSVARDSNPGLNGWSFNDYSLPFTRNQTLNVAPGVDLNLSRQVRNAANTLLRSEYVFYERDPVQISEPNVLTSDKFNTNRRAQRGRTLFHDDPTIPYAGVVSTDFDGVGRYRIQQTEGSFPGSNMRNRYEGFNPFRGTYTIDPATGNGSGFNILPSNSPWVLDTKSFTRDFENGTYSWVDHCYHPGTAVPVRQRIRRLDSSTPFVGQSAQDLVIVNDLRDPFTGTISQGNVRAEKFYGGNAQGGIPTGVSDPCSMALPAFPEIQINHTYSSGVRTTSQYSGTSFFLVNNVSIDANTGLVSFSRDSSDIGTTFRYDAMGRLTWVRPDAPHGGWTEHVYAPASEAGVTRAVVTTRRRDNGSESAPILAVSQSIFDYFGRPFQETRRLPGGAFTKSETLYDGAGNKASVSEWTTGQPAQKTQFFSYDPFGRPATIQPPDGASHNVTLSYAGVRQVSRTVKVATAVGSETNAITTETYDRHGRLLQVTEPSGNADANVTTSYGYDVGNRLASVSTTAFVAGVGNVTQNRSFSYDRAGLLQSETHPELGASGNGTTTYPRYDSRGKLLRKVDGGNDLTYLYDSAERLFQIRETFGGQRTLKSFTYANANGTFNDPLTGLPCTDYRKAKLTQQSRFNYVTVVGSPFTVELREGMTYCGRGGSLSRQTLDNYVNGGTTPSESFVLPNVTYDALGNVTSLAYPQCSHAACTAPTPRTVTSSYTDDLVTSVGIPSNPAHYASSITYHPNLMVNQVVHSNSLTDTYANDPNLMRRPSSISVTTPSAVVRWATGTYGYDGAGNVKSIGTHIFVYDKVSRLKTGNLYLEPNASTTLRTQTYTYDAFGNILAVGGNGARNTPTTSATNHLSSGNYDGSGNLTSLSGSTYAYDPFNLMWNYRTLSDEWIYLYTADDERAWSYKTDNTSLWTLRGIGNQVLREYANNGTWSVNSDFVHRGGSLLAAETPQGIRHFHLDHLGTPRLVSNGGGQQTAYHVYYPFGEEATVFNQDMVRAKFTGHERDFGNLAGAGDDLDYMHARHCSPLMGRFLSFDPVGGNTRAPQSWNRYSYVMNRPLLYTDPAGLFAMPIHYLPPVGMTLENYGYAMGITVASSAWRGTNNNPNTGLWGVTALASGRGLLDWIATGGGLLDVSRARGFYQDNFEHYAVEGNAAMAYLNFAVDELFVPDSQGELGVELAMALIPGPLDNAGYAALKSSKITGFTRHALNQAISREGVGVSAKAILDAVKNPIKVAIDQGRGSIRFVGKNAGVVLNEAGKAITLWARNRGGFRIIP